MINFLKEYFIRVRKEFSIISWPDANEVYQTTILVAVVAVVLGAGIGFFDYLFNKLFFLLIS